MARPTLNIEYGRKEDLTVSPSNIQVDPTKNGRAFAYEFDDLLDLLQDLKDGLTIKQSPTVEVKEKELWVVAGYRRVAAATVWELGDEQHGIEPHPAFKIAVSIEKPASDLDALILNVRENIARKDLSPIDLGALCVRFKEAGKTAEDVAKLLGVSPAQVSQHTKLVTELPEFIQRLVDKRTITADDAFTILKVEPEKRLEILNSYLETKATGIIENAESASKEGPESSEGNPAPLSTPSEGPKKGKKSLRDIAVGAGQNVGSKRMPEYRKYLKEAIETEGPGSHPGEVALKKEILKFLDGKLTEAQMDNRFVKFCKEKV